MKPTTVEAKLNALFGDKFVQKVEEVKAKTTGKVVGVTEEEIQEFREIQGILYFLQAPALFTHKVCGHCGEHYYVSRKNIKYCSYTCIKLELRKMGFEWRKGNDIEALVLDPQVYDGNEPLWIRSQSLRLIREMVLSLPENLPEPIRENITYTQIVEQDLGRISASKSTTQSDTTSVPTTTTSGTPRLTNKSNSTKPKFTLTT